MTIFFPANEILHDFLQKLIFAPVGRKISFCRKHLQENLQEKTLSLPPPSTPPSTIINSSEGPTTAMMTR
jgi:hypothetical protein